MREIYEVNTPTKKVLKSALQKDITVYKFFFMPLCVIESDVSKEYWLFEHFTNIYYIKMKKNGYTWLDYLELNGFYDDVLTVVSRSYDEVKDKDIVDLIKEQINNGHFAVPFVDEFYLNGSYKGIRHLISDIFISGYDDEKEVFVGIGYSDSHAINYVTFSYEEIRKGYSAFTTGVVNIDDCFVWIKDSNFTSYQLLQTESGRKFDYSLFKRDIKRYFTSESLMDMLRPQNVKEFGDDALFGMEAQNATLESIKALKNDVYKTDYRQMHLLSEHKKLLLKKFNYVNENIEIIEKSVIDRCKIVATKFEFARLLYLKAAMKQKSMYDSLTDKNVIEKIISLLQDGISIEKEYLNDYLNRET